MQEQGRTRLNLYGPFGLLAPSGVRVEVTSKKGAALIAMLALSSDGERTRGWLQDRLWGSRERAQAQNSLRRELSQLRAILDAGGVPILCTDGGRVSLTLSQVEIVARKPGQDLLEGFDIPGEDGFEDWLREQRQANSPADPDSSAALSVPALPATFHRTPSIAILPFLNLTGNSDEDYLAEGIGEELADRVSRLRWLPVISPGQSFVADGAEGSLEAGRRLGSAYVLGGKLRRQDNDYWLSAQIIECATGRLIWSPRLRLPAPQASNAMDPIVAEMVAALDNRVDAAEQVRAQARPETDLTVNDLIWRGRRHQNLLTRTDMDVAGEYFDEALRLAPDSSLAIVEYAQHLAYKIWNGRAPESQFNDIREHAQRAIQLDHEDARAHMLAGLAETWMRRPEAAETILHRAISLNPSLPIAHDQLATLYNLSGRGEEAKVHLKISLRLCPIDFRLFYKQGELGLANLIIGDFTAAADHAGQSITLRPSYWHAHVIRINALVRGKHQLEARKAVEELMAARPRFVPDYIDWVPFVDRTWNQYLRAGLAAATNN